MDVFLKCTKEKNKLRLRITTPGYDNNILCQVPRSIKQEGFEYKVLSSDISIKQDLNGKFYYRIRNINNVSKLDVYIQNLFKSDECCICLDKLSEYIFVPCGHLCVCKECAEEWSWMHNKCPMCSRDVYKSIKV